MFKTMHAECTESHVSTFVFLLTDIYCDETKHKIQLIMCTLFLYPIFPSIQSLVQYNTASTEKAF